VDDNSLAGAIDTQSLTLDTAQISDSAVTAAKIGAGAVTGPKLATGILNITVADGVNENTTDITVTGMATGDEIVRVLVLTTKASIASMASRAAGDFVAGTAKAVSTANKTDNSNNQYIIFWNDLTA
jgi:hypothetical protein